MKDILGLGARQDRDKVLADLLGDKRRLILSEENFIGLMVTPEGQLVKDALYAKAKLRLERLANKLKPHRLHLLLGIRNPATFLTSLYSQALMRGNFQTWDAFIQGAGLENYSWSNLIANLQSNDCFASITVWPFEDYHAIIDPLMDHVLGTPRRGLQKELEIRSHEGLSAQAVEACAAWHAQGEVGPLGAVAREDYPVSADAPKFQPWPRAARQWTRNFYADDLDKIAQMDGIKLLRAGQS